MSNQSFVDSADSILTDNAKLTPLSSRGAFLQTLGVFIFGAIVLLVLGFAPMPVVHNATHDTRHSITLPCH